MGRRLDLHAMLINILGSQHVYFQPPSNMKMVYPCIVYQRDRAKTEFADDNPYLYAKRYQVTVIDRNPDSGIPDKVAALPKCLFSAFYTADNLNHDSFNIFF